MDIEISNVRGIEAASIEVDKISLIAGPNGAGKSSVAVAVAAALMQNPAPLPGMKKADAKLLLRDNQKRGRVEVIDGKKKLAANWPGGSVSADGMKTGSAVSCGIVRVPEIASKDLPVFLSELLDCAPSYDDLAGALPDIEHPVLKAIWNEAQENGWDKAYARAREKGAKLKGGWEHITGEKWGAKKAQTWCPDGLDAESLPDLETVEARVAEAEAEVHRVVGNLALSEERRQSLKEKVSEAEQATSQLDEVKATKAELDQRVADLKAKLQGLPRPTAEQVTLDCPHCQKGVVISNGGRELSAPVEVDAQENEARSAAITETQRELQEVEHDRNNKAMALDFLNQTIAAGEKARAELENRENGTATEQDLADARASADHEIYVRDQLNRYFEASRKAQSIDTSAKIADALATTGVRQKVLDRKMGDLNDRLSEMCKAADWPVVSIDAGSLSIDCDGRPYALLSESEKFRTSTALQLAVAEIQGPPMVVVDAADILDRAGRNGLFRMLKIATVPVLVTMTMSARDEVPDLSKAGLGRSYWLESSATTAI